MSDTKRKYSFVRIILRIIPMQFKSTPWLDTVCELLGIAEMLVLAYSVKATQGLFDAIANAAAGKIGFRDCLLPLLLLAGTNLGFQILDGLAIFSIHTINGKSTGKIKMCLHRKLQRIDASHFEDTAFLDDLNKAMEGALVIPYFCCSFNATIFCYVPYFVLMGAYLVWLKPILLIILALSFIPTFLAQVVRAKVYTKLEIQSAPLRRECEYYQKTLCDREYFKETRMLGVFKFFHKLFADSLLLLTRKTWQAGRKTALIELTLNFSAFAGMAASIYMLFTATMAGQITIGAFVAVFYGLGSIFGIMNEIISIQAGNLNRDIGKVANFIRMLDMPEREGTDGTPDFSKGIVARNINFTYPGRDTPAVKDVSLTIADGETIAIVGENGAGKSTLVRLLTGIYRPSEGKVIVGGLDTTEIAPASVYQGTSGVFQKYQRYKMTLCENVAISNTKAEAHATRIESALCEIGAELEGIELNTMLSPEFDGIDLSGGQWQLLAIARGMYRTNGFIVLDEPTAAIDPIEETRVYMRFQRLAEGKCAVVVTHRLGSAKLAHRIVVMDDGKIVDIGTHEELLARQGKYSDMWTAQALWYER